MLHSYSHVYKIPVTIIRFFTVYGPWGRPDMALFKFTEAIVGGRPINIYNYGEMIRDFTYIDDVVESVARLIQRPANYAFDFDPKAPDPGSSSAPWAVFNIGNSQPLPLLDYISTLERALGKTMYDKCAYYFVA